MNKKKVKKREYKGASVKKYTTTLSPTALRVLKPPAFKDVTPIAFKAVNLTALKDVKPTAFKDVKPTAFKDVKPTAFKDVKPTAFKTVKPTASKDVKPTASKDVKPTAFKAVKRTAFKAINPTAFKAVKKPVVVVVKKKKRKKRKRFRKQFRVAMKKRRKRRRRKCFRRPDLKRTDVKDKFDSLDVRLLNAALLSGKVDASYENSKTLPSLIGSRPFVRARKRIGKISIWNDNADAFQSLLHLVTTAGFIPDSQALNRLFPRFLKSLLKDENECLVYDKEAKEEIELYVGSPKWFRYFLNQNQDIKLRRKGQNYSAALRFTQRVLKLFYDELEWNVCTSPKNIFTLNHYFICINTPQKCKSYIDETTQTHFTSHEECDSMRIIACCNALGEFLPPVLVLKGVNIEREFRHEFEAGWHVFGNKFSANFHPQLFSKWFLNDFTKKIPDGKTLLILDGRKLHRDTFFPLKEPEVNIQFLPTLITRRHRPLGSCFSILRKSFNHMKKVRRSYLKQISETFCMADACAILREAWRISVSNSNEKSWFESIGIYPYNPDALRHHSNPRPEVNINFRNIRIPSFISSVPRRKEIEGNTCAPFRPIHKGPSSEINVIRDLFGFPASELSKEPVNLRKKKHTRQRKENAEKSS